HPSNQALRPLLHFTGHQQTIRSVAWSPDGEFLASGGDDAQVIVWTPDGLPHASIEHQAAVQTLAWSPEGSRLMSGSAHLVRFFTALTGNQLATHQHAGQVNSVAWSTHGHLLAVSASDDKRAIVWQTEEYLQQIVFTGHTAAILATTFSADGRTIASSSLGGVVRVWTAATGAELHPLYQDTLLPIPALAFAPSRTDLATGSTDGVMRLWNAFQCQAVRTSDQGPLCTDAPLRFQQTHGAIRTLAWSPDGRYLASGSDDGALALWDLVQSKTPVLSVLIQLYAAIHSIAWSPDSTSLVTAAGTTATIWHLDA
ncbi:MAG: WD40 repeat domain-containing protein, partial [Ktedonobacteraceae bacterium]